MGVEVGDGVAGGSVGDPSLAAIVGTVADGESELAGVVVEADGGWSAVGTVVGKAERELQATSNSARSPKHGVTFSLTGMRRWIEVARRDELMCYD